MSFSNSDFYINFIKVKESFAGIGDYHISVLASNLLQQDYFSLPDCETKDIRNCPKAFRDKLETVIFTYRAVSLKTILNCVFHHLKK